MKLLLLLVILLVHKAYSEPEINCNYINLSSYKCELAINNPENFDDFINIPGNHVDGFNDSSVVIVEAINQRTSLIPSIICLQFVNLIEIFIEMSRVEVLTQQAFANCHNLEILNLAFNDIEEIPNGVFEFNTNLVHIELASNQISEIYDDSFAGSNVMFLDLNYNQLSDLNWISNVIDSLAHLFVVGNRITSLATNVFFGFNRLRTLNLSENLIEFIPPHVFRSLIGLNSLSMNRMNITTFDQNWLRTMTVLSELHMNHNSISSIPRTAFTALFGVTHIDMSHNRISELNLHSFGARKVNITSLDFEFNEIASIDGEIIEISENLVHFLLIGNGCVDRNFYNFNDDRDCAREALGMCVENFGFAHCDFINVTQLYTCMATIHNPTGRNTFARVTGTHLDGGNDLNLRAITGINQLTRNMPRIFCDQYVFVTHISFTYSGIETLSTDSFMSCGNLERLSLGYNSIKRLPDDLFNLNRNLMRADFYNNEISEIAASAFADTRLNEILLNHNEINEFNAETFSILNSTLEVLNLAANKLSHLPANSFSNLLNLRQLNLDNNWNLQIASSAFDNLRNLDFLSINSANLTSLDANWFRDLRNLTALKFAHNEITEIDAGTFDSLSSVNQIDLASNKMEVLRLNSFGNALNTLSIFFLEFNNINFIEEAIFTTSESLNLLFLADNVCTSENFINLQINRDEVITALAPCIRNFNGFVKCKFYSSHCNLEILNINSRDDFEAIEGEHLEGYDNHNITAISGDFQNTRNIPRIICETFINLRQLTLEDSRINEIHLENCVNLNIVRLGYNNIRELSSNAFENSRNLQTLILNNNEIEKINDEAFVNTAIVELNLDYNRISEINFDIINSTLERLFLSNNQINSLAEGTFDNLSNLKMVNLANNQLFELPSHVFSQLGNLETLILHHCNISELSDELFNGLSNLVDLRLHNNQISSLSSDLFNNLPSLIEIDLSYNEIYTIQDLNLPQLRYFFINSNNIFAIDESFMQNSANLQWLFASNNICIDNIFITIDNATINQLSECFTNFITNEIISCDFIDMNGDYSCILSIFNPSGRSLFGEIEGNHVNENGDDDVTSVYANNQNSRNFPVILCNIYASLQSIYFSASRINSLNSNSFENCINLETLSLNFNQLTALPDELFINNRNLHVLQVVSNQLRELSPFAFTGSSLRLIDLSGNQLSLFSSAFEAVNVTLNVLQLTLNQISNLGENSFENLRNLQILNLNNNPLSNLPDSIFSPLVNLQTLALINCQMSSLNPNWFNRLISLQNLHLSHNSLTEIPPEIFNLLFNALLINVAENNLTTLDTKSFGYSLTTLETIYAYGNQINSIDREFLSDFRRVNTLMLNGNVCTQENFINVRENLENVRQQLSVCFDNFDGM